MYNWKTIKHGGVFRFVQTMASLTQRNSGLVQRRTEASRNAAEKSPDEDEHESRRGEEEDDDQGDSKETRLTLMEEVLLLGLKDREVWPDFCGFVSQMVARKRLVIEGLDKSCKYERD